MFPYLDLPLYAYTVLGPNNGGPIYSFTRKSGNNEVLKTSLFISKFTDNSQNISAFSSKFKNKREEYVKNSK